MPSDQPPVPKSPDTTRITPELLLQLALMTGADFDEKRAVDAIANSRAPGISERERLTLVAGELFRHADPESMPLKDLVWRARNDTPVVVNAERSDGRIYIITAADWLRVRVIDTTQPERRLTITRGQLAAKLGLSNVDEIVAATVIDPEYHSRHIRAESFGGHEAAHGISPTRRFFGLIRCEREDIRLFVLFSIFSAIMYLGSPLAVDALVSNLAFGNSEQPYVQAVVVIALAFGGCLILHAMSNAFLHYISELIQRRIFVRTAADLAHRLPRVDIAAIEDEHAPEIVNRFLDIATLQKSVATLLLEGVNLVFGGGVGMILLALYHPYLLIFVLVLAAVIFVILRYMGLGAVESSVRESRMKYDLVNWFEEIAHFPLLFKGPGGHELASRRTNRIVSEYLEARAAHFRILMRQISALLLLQVIAGAGLLIIGGYLVLSQQLTLGQLVASEIIISGIVSSLGKLGKKLEAWYDALAAMDKLGQLIDLPPERASGERHDSPNAEPAAITVNGMHFGHLEGRPLFENISFRVSPGERIAITGPHGAGASTLLDLLYGVRSPAAGHITIDDVDLRTWSLESLRSECLFIRRNEIITGTLSENLRLGRSDIGADEVRAALRRVGLLDMLRNRPEGLDLRLRIGGAPLSGFQRTRLLLARALILRPRLLLLDDLLDGLDGESLTRIAPVVFSPARPWTVIIATRDPRVLALCDRTVNLDRESH